ncbi:MAG: hypothetical protein ACYTBS_26625 [Planctomycetota bacterium]
MKKLGAGIIGCGWVAEEYVKAFEKDERSNIRGLVSRNQVQHRDRCRYHAQAGRY